MPIEKRRKSRVLLTRAKEANEKLKKQLADQDLEILECNLLEYKLLPFDYEQLKNYSGLIITSNFAAKNLPIAPHENMRAYVVGTECARILTAKNYKIVCCAPSAVHLKNQLPDKNQNLLYLSANHITLEMPDYVKRVIFYEVKYLKTLKVKQITAIKQGIDYILLYSENCAKTLLKLVYNNDLINSLASTTIIAISSKVGSVFSGVCKNIIIANGAENMLKFIK